MANAAEHGPGHPIGLLIRQHTTQSGQPGITCEVTDTSRHLPGNEPAQPDHERGCGLAIVVALAADSGYLSRPDGKTAWFTLTTPEPARAPELEAGS